MTAPFHDIDRLPSQALADMFAEAVGHIISLSSVLNATTDEEMIRILSDENLPKRNADRVRVRAFGASSYEPKTMDEFRRYFIAAMEYGTKLIKEGHP